jgi:serine/threonine protein kinase
MRQFRTTHGIVWSFDPAKILGTPGGFGSVYLGYAADDTEVAVKLVPLQEETDAERKQRNRELQIASRLASLTTNHLLIPIDYGYDGNDLLIVMPRASRSLKDAIDDGLDEPSQRTALLHIALGLQELSEAAILHRDLKPQNVLELNGVWRIADFGISRDLGQPTATHTFFGAGTLPYMAPELWQMQPATIKTDLYSFGCLAFEVFAGRRPFPGPDRAAFRQQHLREQPPPLPETVDPGLARLVLRLLAKEPARRPQDARAVVEELDRIGSGLTQQQERLRQRAYRHEQRRVSEEASERASQWVANTAEERRQQAMSDLDETVYNASCFVAQAIPDVELVESPWPTSHAQPFHEIVGFAKMLRIGESGITFVTWRRSPVPATPDDRLVLAGSIIRGAPSLDFLSSHLDGVSEGNIVYEEKSGRLGWFLYRLAYAALIAETPTEYENFIQRALDPGSPESLDVRFGLLNSDEFNEKRIHMLPAGLYGRQIQVEPLDNESIARLLEEQL